MTLDRIAERSTADMSVHAEQLTESMKRAYILPADSGLDDVCLVRLLEHAVKLVQGRLGLQVGTGVSAMKPSGLSPSACW